MKYLLQQKTSNPDFFISGKEEKLNNILCSCLCCAGQLLYFQNRNWNISTESWLHHNMYHNCPSVWKGENLFAQVCIHPPDFQEQSLGYLFLYLYLYFCQYLHPYLWAPVAWDFWEQGWRWDGGRRVIARPPKQLTTMTSSIGKAALQPLYFKPCICCGSTLYLPYIHTSMHLILLYCFTLYEFSTFF